MEALQKSTATVLECWSKKCKPIMEDMLKETMQVQKTEIAPLIQSIVLKHQEFKKGAISEKAYKQHVQDTITKVKKVKERLITSKKVLAIQECSVKHCQEQNKKNIKVLEKVYTELCKDKKTACPAAQQAAKLSKKKTLTAKDLVVMIQKEKKV